MTNSTLKNELMSDLPFRYERDEKMCDYVFMKGNRVLFRATSLAICYSKDTQRFGQPNQPVYFLHKHGAAEDVLKHAHQVRDKYRQAGSPELASEVVVILSDLWDVEILNRIISNTSFLRRFIEEQHNPFDSENPEIASGQQHASSQLKSSDRIPPRRKLSSRGTQLPEQATQPAMPLRLRKKNTRSAAHNNSVE